MESAAAFLGAECVKSGEQATKPCEFPAPKTDLPWWEMMRGSLACRRPEDELMLWKSIIDLRVALRAPSRSRSQSDSDPLRARNASSSTTTKLSNVDAMHALIDANGNVCVAASHLSDIGYRKRLGKSARTSGITLPPSMSQSQGPAARRRRGRRQLMKSYVHGVGTQNRSLHNVRRLMEAPKDVPALAMLDFTDFIAQHFAAR
jgi:hypothetical protein